MKSDSDDNLYLAVVSTSVSQYNILHNSIKYVKLYLNHPHNNLFFNIPATDIEDLKLGNERNFGINSTTRFDSDTVDKFLEEWPCNDDGDQIETFSIIPYCDQRLEELKQEGIAMYAEQQKDLNGRLAASMTKRNCSFTEATTIKIYYNFHVLNPYFSCWVSNISEERSNFYLTEFMDERRFNNVLEGNEMFVLIHESNGLEFSETNLK